ncbi:MAG: hypothetical protein JWO42_945 [Chloroflexi bacterium]|nr:hypothetical protein [Chloroflexota bacterium]
MSYREMYKEPATSRDGGMPHRLVTNYTGIKNQAQQPNG